MAKKGKNDQEDCSRSNLGLSPGRLCPLSQLLLRLVIL